MSPEQPKEIRERLVGCEGMGNCYGLMSNDAITDIQALLAHCEELTKENNELRMQIKQAVYK